MSGWHKEKVMKIIAMAMLMAGMSATGYAADFSDLQSFKTADIKVSEVSGAAPVSAPGAVNKASIREFAALPANDKTSYVALMSNCNKQSALIMLEQALAAIKKFNVSVSDYGLVDVGDTYSDPRFNSYIAFSGEEVLLFNSEYYLNYKPANARHTKAMLQDVNAEMEGYSNVMENAALRTASIGAVNTKTENSSGFRFGILYHPEGALRLRAISYSAERDGIITTMKNKGYSFVGNSYLGTRDIARFSKVLTNEDYMAKKLALENAGNEILLVTKNPQAASVAEYTITYLQK